MRHLGWVGIVLVALLTAGCGGATAGTGGFVTGDGTVTVLPVEQRQPAPLIEGTTLEGQPWRSDSITGKVIVYNVWGSWCAPCRAEAGELVAASQALADQAEFVGLNTRDLDPSAPKAFVRAFDVPYVNLFDPDGALLLQFSGQLPANAIPSTLIVDAQGRIAARIIGATTQATLVGLVEEVGGKP